MDAVANSMDWSPRYIRQYSWPLVHACRLQVLVKEFQGTEAESAADYQVCMSCIHMSLLMPQVPCIPQIPNPVNRCNRHS